MLGIFTTKRIQRIYRTTLGVFKQLADAKQTWIQNMVVPNRAVSRHTVICIRKTKLQMAGPVGKGAANFVT